MQKTFNLMPFEEGIIQDLIEDHGLSAEEAQKAFMENKQAIDLLSHYEPTDFFADQIMKNRKRNISGAEWVKWIRQKQAEYNPPTVETRQSSPRVVGTRGELGPKSRPTVYAGLSGLTKGLSYRGGRKGSFRTYGNKLTASQKQKLFEELDRRSKKQTFK